MAEVQEQTIEISFHKGLDTKTDPFRLSIGNFTSLVNTVFDKLGRLTKRPGFASITTLTTPASFLTTFKDNLLAIGSSIQAFVSGTAGWINAGSFTPVNLSVLPLIRNSLNQTQVDTAISANNLVCTVYAESTGSALAFKYAVADSITGQNVILPTALAADTTLGYARVFYLGTYFVIVYTNHPAAYNLKYIAINTQTLVVNAPITVSTSVTPETTQAFDGVVYNGTLYVAWNGAAASGIKMATLSNTLSLSAAKTLDAAHVATTISVAADSVNSNIWVSYYNAFDSTGYTLAVSASGLASILAATQIISSGVINNITSIAASGVNKIFYDQVNYYAYDGAIRTDFINTVSVTQAGSVGSTTVSARSVALASKAFVISGSTYFLASYQSPYQSTFFLINGSTSVQTAPVVVAKLAYANGGGYLSNGLPSVNVNGVIASVGYLYKDLIQAANKNTNVPSGSQINGIYTQTGINLASFDFSTNKTSTVELGNNLNISGGFMWMYDGFAPVEQNFFLYPDSVEVTTATGSGALTAQDYFYIATYEWGDNQGNIHRSSISIPVKQTTTTSSSTNTIKVPSLRLTYKSNVRVCLYRWSTAQQIYYQVTSLSTPTLNTLSSDQVTITDALADSSILGNNILYTNGGVLEDTNSNAMTSMAIFDTRLFGIFAEDNNLLGYSKQVIENTPVEMSQLLTRYVAPSRSATGNSVESMQCIFPMDEKLIIFKKSSIYYINGTGPDNTGQNSQYSEPIFITSPVGCDNPNSIVLTPNGLMFQSQNGIWLLNRSLGVSYIGAEVEAYNSNTVLSAVAVPGTNRIMFTLDSGIRLMFDYYVGQWGVHQGISGTSSVIYNNLHAYLSAQQTVTPPSGQPYTIPSQVYQETPGKYLDGGKPVLMSFITGWINPAGLQGYLRSYWLEFLSTFLSPHKFGIGIAYNFDSTIVQYAGVAPDNWSSPWGSDPTWGQSTPYGGSSMAEQWQINFRQQQCQSFQLTFNESFDPSHGTTPGEGLSISSLQLTVGLMKGYPRNIAASHRTG